MGRRRKVVELQQAIAAYEDKTSNVSSETELGVEKLHSHAENSNSMEAMNVIKHIVQQINGVKRDKDSRLESLVVRRSNRIRSLALAPPTDSIGVRPVVEHVNLLEDDKEQDTEIQQEEEVRVPQEVNGRDLEEKVDYLVRAADELKSKLFTRQDGGPFPDISYKSLYIDSQKKIESLVEENYDLVRKLEYAHGKIAAYEVMKNVVGAKKEVILVSATDIAASFSLQAPPPPAYDPKPKKTYKKQAIR